MMATLAHDSYSILLSGSVAIIGAYILLRVGTRKTDVTERTQLEKLRGALLTSGYTRGRLAEGASVSIARLDHDDKVSPGPETKSEQETSIASDNKGIGRSEARSGSGSLTPSPTVQEVVRQQLGSGKLSVVKDKVMNKIAELYPNDSPWNAKIVDEIAEVIAHTFEDYERRNRRWDLIIGFVYATTGVLVAVILKFA